MEENKRRFGWRQSCEANSPMPTELGGGVIIIQPIDIGRVTHPSMDGRTLYLRTLQLVGWNLTFTKSQNGTSACDNRIKFRGNRGFLSYPISGSARSLPPYHKRRTLPIILLSLSEVTWDGAGDRVLAEHILWHLVKHIC
jgi:hypothetical protein